MESRRYTNPKAHEGGTEVKTKNLDGQEFIYCYNRTCPVLADCQRYIERAANNMDVEAVFFEAGKEGCAFYYPKESFAVRQRRLLGLTK